MKSEQPILITGADRSGSTFIARVLYLCGGFVGDCTPMYENESIRKLHHYILECIGDGCTMPTVEMLPKHITEHYWRTFVHSTFLVQGLPQNCVYLYKDSSISHIWQLWKNSFPEAKWIIVRRKPSDIVNSCINTGYMKRFKFKENLDKIGVSTEAEGWKWWVRQYEARFVEIVTSGVDYQIVWPERMADGDFQQMKEIVKWVGLTWNPDVEKILTPLFKNRK